MPGFNIEGTNILIDGSFKRNTINLLTHMHSDHIKVDACKPDIIVYCSEETAGMKNGSCSYIGLPLDTHIRLPDGTITVLIDNAHCIGSVAYLFPTLGILFFGDGRPLEYVCSTIQRFIGGVDIYALIYDNRNDMIQHSVLPTLDHNVTQVLSLIHHVRPRRIDISLTHIGTLDLVVKLGLPVVFSDSVDKHMRNALKQKSPQLICNISSVTLVSRKEAIANTNKYDRYNNILLMPTLLWFTHDPNGISRNIFGQPVFDKSKNAYRLCVSAHASRQENAMLIELVKPEVFIAVNE